MELNTPKDYIEMAVRRKWSLIIPFALVMLASPVVYNKLPKIFKATTLILVQPQQVPQTYVRSTTTQSVSDRLDFITHQILSRVSLEQVITQLHLINDPSDTERMRQLVEWMKNSIEIEVNRGSRPRETANSFAISFMDRNPMTAARIVNMVASLFITKNQKIREEESLGTSQFLEKELRDTEKRLMQKQESIRKFKEQYMGELPGQLDTNLRVLERLRLESDKNEESILLAQQKREKLQSQIYEMRTTRSYEPEDEREIGKDPLYRELNEKKQLLRELELQYTDKHPDVIATQTSIEELEAQMRERESVTTGQPKRKVPWVDPRVARLNQDLDEVNEQLDQLLRAKANLTNQMDVYRQRVENAPKREEQMSTLLRDHNLLQENYQRLLDKKIQAELSRELEKTQRGEQFKILDPATPPISPFKPDKRKVFGLAFLLGLGFGGGLAFLMEQLDRSFHEADEVEQFLGFPVIATLPRMEGGKTARK